MKTNLSQLITYSHCLAQNTFQDFCQDFPGPCCSPQQCVNIQKQLLLTSNVTSVTEVQSARLFAGMWHPDECYYNTIMLWLFLTINCGIVRFLCALHYGCIRSPGIIPSSSPRLPLCQISFLSQPPLLSLHMVKNRVLNQSLTHSLTQLIWCPGNRMCFKIFHKTKPDHESKFLLHPLIWCHHHIILIKCDKGGIYF